MQPSSENDTDESDGRDMLMGELASDCWTPADVACKPLRGAGFSKKQIWSLSKRLGVVRKKSGFQGTWYWRLPGDVDPDLPAEPTKDSLKDSKDSSLKKGESLESLEEMESSGPADEGGVEL